MRRTLIIAGGALVAILLAAGMIILTRPHSAPKGSIPLIDEATLKLLPAKDLSLADTTHLAPSVPPPTNSWLSGMVLQKVPQPVYPMPLSFRAQETGFEIGLPTIAVTPTVISGGHTAGISASITEAASFQLSRYDKLSATLTYRSMRGSDIGNLTLAQGVPFVYYHALTDGEVVVADAAPTFSTAASPHYLRYKKAGHDYIITTSENAPLTISGTTTRIKLSKDSLVTFYALPDDRQDTLRQYAANEVTGTIISHQAAGQIVSTTLRYDTATRQPTVYAPMGYKMTTQSSSSLTEYDSIYGTMKAVAGNEFTTSVSMSPTANQIDLTHITEQHKQALIKTLKNDASSTKVTAQDSYFAGKQLARAANLLELAIQLNQTAVADQLSMTLKDALTARLSGDYFYYDSKLKGVAATTKAFGSEEFNDHHFHYGYFIYAASILGKHDPSFLNEYKNKVNLLVADIASYDSSASFPAQRYFDAYSGHSWAAGLAPFADGNNQESSSEATNAWNAVVLWSELIHNTQLNESSKWMFANESATARAIWRLPPDHIPGSATYKSPLTSLNFSGKRTYSTFFSDEPNAKLGIQLLPMSPYMAQQVDDAKIAKQLIDSSIPNGTYNVALGDYILMYLSLYDKQRALDLVDKQQDNFIDDGNSRTYLAAFVYSQTDK